ncbi:5-oxoprolinase subunit PxpB [Planomicrobium okeanokoites]|uniref:5-oxoprolinase subunit PxpB n=1 Tax=Planomicrobium okeanokoites TaxID=244 RepID=A0ABV7KIL7_PLAOK|nr:5-oxoprolinase subunit PxpB [Planomicrobium okeanokoites]TAA69021.1 5-oxoprolinase subunit PxpB [Planomicrobium okeanokoites]
MDYSFSPLGDQTIILEIGNEINEETHHRVRAVTALLETDPPQWMSEFIPAFTTVSIVYSPLQVSYEEAKLELAALLKNASEITLPPPRTIELPVCYGGDHGPDLEYVARHNGLSAEEVIAIHTGASYTVHMIGFAPGFPYLGGMSEKIAAPRKVSPRVTIPERSVGIAGNQTGVYPISTPGGWQLIGRTPTRLFLPDHEIPSLLSTGDTVVFRQITADEYQTLEEKENAYHT